MCVRTALVPFICTTGVDGLTVLTAEPSIVCDAATSTVYGRMRAIGTTSLLLYGVGLPLTFLGILYRYRYEMFMDQLLRIRNEGETGLTNPHIHIRRRFRKLYEDFKPDCRYWKVALLLRKFALALIGIGLAGRSELQVLHHQPPAMRSAIAG